MRFGFVLAVVAGFDRPAVGFPVALRLVPALVAAADTLAAGFPVQTLWRRRAAALAGAGLGVGVLTAAGAMTPAVFLLAGRW